MNAKLNTQRAKLDADLKAEAAARLAATGDSREGFDAMWNLAPAPLDLNCRLARLCRERGR